MLILTGTVGLAAWSVPVLQFESLFEDQV